MKKAETYEVEEISAGVADDCHWVSIGFSSSIEKQDVLHVVCALSVDAQDRKLGHDSIYLERFDQAYSCYSGAEKISVGLQDIHFALNPEGGKALSLPRSVSFAVPPRLKGWSAASRIFKRMSSMECGRVVTVAGKTSPTSRSTRSRAKRAPG